MGFNITVIGVGTLQGRAKLNDLQHENSEAGLKVRSSTSN